MLRSGISPQNRRNYCPPPPRPEPGHLIGAADHGRGGAAAAVILEAEARREPRDVRHVEDIAFRHLVGGEDRHRQRNLLKEFLALVRGDDDFFQSANLRLLLSLGHRCVRGARRERERDGRLRSVSAFSCHGVFPHFPLIDVRARRRARETTLLARTIVHPWCDWTLQT
jgi:hypothetical protein